MSRSLSILMICVSLTACATIQPEQARLDVQRASDQFWAARERGDVSAFVEQFTDDGIFMVPGLKDAAGRTAVRELAQKRFAAAKITDFKVLRREIEVIGDSAHELAWYSEVHRGQGEAMRLEGRYLIVWKRGSDNLWRVSRYVYSLSDAQPV